MFSQPSTCRTAACALALLTFAVGTDAQAQQRAEFDGGCVIASDAAGVTQTCLATGAPAHAERCTQVGTGDVVEVAGVEILVECPGAAALVNGRDVLWALPGLYASPDVSLMDVVGGDGRLEIVAVEALEDAGDATGDSAIEFAIYRGVDVASVRGDDAAVGPESRSSP